MWSVVSRLHTLTTEFSHNFEQAVILVFFKVFFQWCIICENVLHFHFSWIFWLLYAENSVVIKIWADENAYRNENCIVWKPVVDKMLKYFCISVSMIPVDQAGEYRLHINTCTLFYDTVVETHGSLTLFM